MQLHAYRGSQYYDLHDTHTAQDIDTTCATSGMEAVIIVIFMLSHRPRMMVTRQTRGRISAFEVEFKVRLTFVIPGILTILYVHPRIMSYFHTHKLSRTDKSSRLVPDHFRKTVPTLQADPSRA